MPVSLPSSFTGSRRYQYQKYLDNMAIVAKFGLPSLFITMTANTEWTEIQTALAGQEAWERPDIVVRVFRLKMNQLLSELRECNIFGPHIAHTCVVEFQKRGLPHCHVLLFLKDGFRPEKPEHIDKYVSAELPDKKNNPALFDIVAKFMVHRHRTESPCMSDGHCSKGFPKSFKEETEMHPDGSVHYMRRRVVQEGTNITNDMIVPYNPYLLLRFNCHINVEIVHSKSAVKYVYKYLSKGSDMAMGEIRPQDMNDETKEYIHGRYLSTHEALWRVYCFPLIHNYPPVMRLTIHLPHAAPVLAANATLDAVMDEDNGDQMDVDENDEASNSELETDAANEDSDSETESDTTLTAFFKLNQDRVTSGDDSVLFYHDVASRFTFNDKSRMFHKRKKGFNIVPRMTFVDPKNEELYSLRLLLIHVPSPTSFDDLKGNWQTFKEAAVARGLLQSDNSFTSTMDEAVRFQMPAALRELCVSLLIFNGVPTHAVDFNRYLPHLSEDFMLRYDAQTAIAKSLHDIYARISAHGRAPSEFSQILPIVPADAIEIQLANDHPRLIILLNQFELSLTDDQRTIFDEIRTQLLSSHTRKKQYFINGSGGTGKTYLYNALITMCKVHNIAYSVVASTGIAALLLENGQTAHSFFKMSLNPSESSYCSIGANTAVANNIRNTDLFIWDEATMVHKLGMEEVDRTMRLLMKSVDPGLENVPFGGKLFVFGGDWKQTLPVVKRGSLGESLAATIKTSHLWQAIEQRHLRTNMRLRGESNHLESWRSMLESIGTSSDLNETSHFIHLPRSLFLPHNTLPQLIHFTFGNFQSLNHAAILCVTNNDCQLVNDHIINGFPGECHVSVARTEVYDPQLTHPVDQATLDRIHISGFSIHMLNLKVGMPVMLLRNLNIKEGLCNGQIMRILQLGEFTMKVKLTSGKFQSREHVIPKLWLISNEGDHHYMIRIYQFPVAPAFAITINKSQGQTFDKIGVFLTNDVFSHGQLYVALSRTRDPTDIKILTTRIEHNGSSNESIRVKNVVLRSIF